MDPSLFHLLSMVLSILVYVTKSVDDLVFVHETNKKDTFGTEQGLLALGRRAEAFDAFPDALVHVLCHLFEG